MSLRCLLAATLVLAASFAQADEHKLSTVKKGPEGLSPAIAKVVDSNGFKVSGPEGALVEIWLLKEVPVLEKFKPNFTKQYPLTPGQLLGAMRISKGAEYTDFRGQEMDPGVYTLRYGLQPMDGNHVGTSETYDFILALPAKTDKKTDTIKDFQELAEISAKAAGSAHPAIFSLQDPTKVEKKSTLKENDFEHWVLSFVSKGKAKDKDVELKVSLVVVGQSEG